MDDRVEQRRNEDREMARWRGGIDARMEAVERDLRSLTSSSIAIDRSVTRMEGRLDTFQRELAESREEVRAAARDIDRGRENAVQELKDTITARDAAQSAWQLTRFQVFVGGLIALMVPFVSAIVTLAFTGGLK